LSYNRITELDGRIFEPTNKLSTIELSRNLIRALDKDIFRNLPNLTEIDLSYNLLETLDETLFLNNPKLYRIDLNSNRIRALSGKMFQHLTKLKWLMMAANVCVDKWVRYRLMDGQDLVSPLRDVVLLRNCTINYLKNRTLG
jgi:Leucine-rich repeat (LRR) protein